MIFKVDKNEFVNKLLVPASKLSDNLHLIIHQNVIKTFVSSADNSTVLIVKILCKSDASGDCLLPDCKTFLRLFSSIEQEQIELVTDNNSINFNGDKIKFKYHLLDDSYHSTKKSLSEEKLNNLNFDTTFSLNKRGFSEICKFNSIIPDAEKLYFFTKSKQVFAKLGDEEKTHTNELTTHVSDCFEGSDISVNIPINIQSILLMSFADDNITVKINHQLKVLKFETQSGFYIVSGLVK